MYSWCLLLPVDLPKFGISMDTSTTTEEILLGGWRDFSVCDGVIWIDGPADKVLNEVENRPANDSIEVPDEVPAARDEASYRKEVVIPDRLTATAESAAGTTEVWEMSSCSDDCISWIRAEEISVVVLVGYRFSVFSMPAPVDRTVKKVEGLIRSPSVLMGLESMSDDSDVMVERGNPDNSS